ncbi:MAG TPA: hypothetical protein PKH23_02135, partial [Bacillota bacterium]|nr:hypothetical protein [Bacillota bacterium]
TTTEEMTTFEETTPSTTAEEMITTVEEVATEPLESDPANASMTTALSGEGTGEEKKPSLLLIAAVIAAAILIGSAIGYAIYAIGKKNRRV